MTELFRRGFQAKYNQDSIDIWLLRDGIELIWNHKVSEVSKILNDLGWRSEEMSRESVAFEDAINYFLHRADKYIGLSGRYSFDSLDDYTVEMKDELQFLVDDMNAVLDELGYEIEFGDNRYIISREEAA